MSVRVSAERVAFRKRSAGVTPFARSAEMYAPAETPTKTSKSVSDAFSRRSSRAASAPIS